MAEKEKNYTIVEDYELPSKGLIYDKPFDPKVKLRSMTTMEEMRRLSPSNTPYKVLADIIEDCLLTKLPIKVYDLCIGDYEYLLHKMRVVSYGPEYKMLVRCPNCGETKEAIINLDDLDVFEYKDEEIKDLMTVTLPVSQRIVSLKYQTPRMLDEIEVRRNELRRKVKDLPYDPTIRITLQLAIDSVDGEKMKYAELESFINNLPIRDSKELLDRIEKINRKVGLDTRFESSCTQCGYDISTFFRFTNEFFGPTN